MAEITYIPINRNKQLGNKTVRLAGMIRECQELADELLSIADRQNDGTDYSTMEANFGLQAGDGSELRSQLSRMKNIFTETNAELTAQQRVNQIDEFASRVGGQ